MGFFRFRRSVKLIPGVRLNFGKRSSSLSFGVRGAHYTVGTRGSRTTVGIPGTGLSYTQVHRTSLTPSDSETINHPSHRVEHPSEQSSGFRYIKATFIIEDRLEGEPFILPHQLEELQAMSQPEDSSFDFHGLGQAQAAQLIQEMKETIAQSRSPIQSRSILGLFNEQPLEYKLLIVLGMLLALMFIAVILK
jgi:hypothetical protein